MIFCSINALRTSEKDISLSSVHAKQLYARCRWLRDFSIEGMKRERLLQADVCFDNACEHSWGDGCMGLEETAKRGRHVCGVPVINSQEYDIKTGHLIIPTCGPHKNPSRMYQFTQPDQT